MVIVGGGPAGLRAAEVATAAGARVQLFEGQAAVGRKFLVAGRGGLNLTHSEPVENFPERYGEEPERWRSLLAEFSPDDLRAWAEELAVETYVGTSGRVFPRGQKAAVLLRAWLKRLACERSRDSSAAALDSPDEIRFWLASSFRQRRSHIGDRSGGGRPCAWRRVLAGDGF